MGPRRPLLIVLFLAIFGAIVFVARTGQHDSLKKVVNSIRPGTAEPKKVAIVGKPCSEHLGWLEPYQFSYPIKYVSRDIIAIPAPDVERPSVSVVDQPLFDEFTTVDLGKSATAEIAKCLPALELHVPYVRREPADASNLIFGLQTTMNRLKETVKHLARWLPHTNARLYAIVIENEELAVAVEDMRKLEQEFQDQGMNVTIVHPIKETDSFAQRYFSLVDVMYGARNDATEWTILIDDDTFFPSMHELQTLLKSHDATRPQYIGSLSEDWWAVNHYGLMGFGGAGIYLSMPMAKIIHDHNDECKEHLRTTAGDISVMDCVYRFTSTKLTHIPSLHQVDMHGDLSGFYESGREIVSVHHWKEGSATGFKLEMEKMHLVADICDTCFLQRWQFPKEILLSNGFSITQYPQGHLSGQKPGGVLGTGVGGTVPKINLEEMERTWADEINVRHSLEPARDKMEDGAKVSYKLLDSVLVNSDPNASLGSTPDVVRQVYFKEGTEKDGGGREEDTVMVLNWRAGEAPKVEVPPV